MSAKCQTVFFELLAFILFGSVIVFSISLLINNLISYKLRFRLVDFGIHLPLSLTVMQFGVTGGPKAVEKSSSITSPSIKERHKFLILLFAQFHSRDFYVGRNDDVLKASAYRISLFELEA